MTANTKLIHAIADALIGEYDEEATEWLEDGGRANIERIVAEWRAAIEQGRWVERLEDVLVLRALRHVPAPFRKCSSMAGLKMSSSSMASSSSPH